MTESRLQGFRGETGMTREAGNNPIKKAPLFRVSFMWRPLGESNPVTAVKGRCPGPDEGDVFGGAKRDQPPTSTLPVLRSPS